MLLSTHFHPSILVSIFVYYFIQPHVVPMVFPPTTTCHKQQPHDAIGIYCNGETDGWDITQFVFQNCPKTRWFLCKQITVQHTTIPMIYVEFKNLKMVTIQHKNCTWPSIVQNIDLCKMAETVQKWLSLTFSYLL